MGYSTLLYIAMLAFGVYACGSTEKKTAAEHKATDSTAVHHTKNDTIKTPPPPKPAPAPGTLRLQGKILSTEAAQNDSAKIYDFKVQKILAIGSATPTVVLNDTLRIAASTRTFLKENMTIDCTISYRQVFGQSDALSPTWQLLRWEDNQDHE